MVNRSGRSRSARHAAPRSSGGAATRGAPRPDGKDRGHRAQREHRCRGDGRLPRDVRQAAHEVRRRGAERERADDDARGQSAAALEVRGDQPHAGRIDAGDRHADEEARRQRGRESAGQQQLGVEDRGGHGRGRHQPARLEPVGEVEQRRADAARDEARLHGDREPGGARGAQVPVARERGHDGRRAEPGRVGEDGGERHAQQCAAREDGRHRTPGAVSSAAKSSAHGGQARRCATIAESGSRPASTSST